MLCTILEPTAVTGSREDGKQIFVALIECVFADVHINDEEYEPRDDVKHG